jgi:AraC-like DNA-binding protein
VDQAVERVVTVMRTRYQERLYVPELAADEFFSPFHFTRIFRRDTGVTPGQYLTAVRLFEAKRLLLTTSLSVAEVACRVGYPGVGTFTTRFTKLVGVSPGRYRRLPAAGMLSITDNAHRFPEADLLRASAPWRANGRGGAIAGSVHFGTEGVSTRFLVAVFEEPIPQGPPIAWTLVPGGDDVHWRLDGLPAGDWVAVAVTEGHPAARGCAPVRVSPGTVARVEIRLRRPHRTDPPIMVPICAHLSAAGRKAM